MTASLAQWIGTHAPELTGTDDENQDERIASHVAHRLAALAGGEVLRPDEAVDLEPRPNVWAETAERTNAIWSILQTVPRPPEVSLLEPAIVRFTKSSRPPLSRVIDQFTAAVVVVEIGDVERFVVFNVDRSRGCAR